MFLVVLTSFDNCLSLNHRLSQKIPDRYLGSRSSIPNSITFVPNRAQHLCNNQKGDGAPLSTRHPCIQVTPEGVFAKGMSKGGVRKENSNGCPSLPKVVALIENMGDHFLMSVIVGASPSIHLPNATSMVRATHLESENPVVSSILDILFLPLC